MWVYSYEGPIGHSGGHTCRSARPVMTTNRTQDVWVYSYDGPIGHSGGYTCRSARPAQRTSPPRAGCPRGSRGRRGWWRRAPSSAAPYAQSRAAPARGGGQEAVYFTFRGVGSHLEGAVELLKAE
eukprot:143262-Prorocentrum_minimum.AAC.2